MGYETTNEGSREGGFVDDLVPEIAQELAWGVLGSRELVEEEIDLMLRTVREFYAMDPDAIGRMIQAMSARCTELCIHLHRLETRREWKQIRTLQVEKLLMELDRQWKIASRVVEIRRQDIELSR